MRPTCMRIRCFVQSIIPSPKQCRSISTTSTSTDTPPDWNSNDEFFSFTRGRFVMDEAENLQKRKVQFDMNELAKTAAAAVGAQCTSITKYPDGMFNKAFLLSMDNGQEVVAKVPNPNAGVPHFTTASEVATMDFVWTSQAASLRLADMMEFRRVLDTPIPHVHTWNSQAQSHPVGAEFIIMDKATGVPLSQTWDALNLSQKLQVLLVMTRLQKQWLRVSFSHYGSLYYAGDVQSPKGNHYIKDGKIVMNSEFAIGPATGRDWMDAGRSALRIQKGPWASAAQYLHAVRMRETAALQSLKPPKQLVMFCGPKLYQPDTEKKLTSLAWYQQIIDVLLPKDTIITSPYLWHNDLHENNIFINPQDPGEITAIIDWQACHISPLFNHNPTPAFIAWEDGPEPETLDLAPKPDLSKLSQEEVQRALHEYTVQNMFIGWHKLMHSKNPDMYQVVEFQRTAEYGLIFLAHRTFEYGEAHFQSLLVELKDEWADGHDVPFPIELSEADIRRIGLNGDHAVGGTDLLTAIKKAMGELWPDKGLIAHEQYDECRSALHGMKAQLIEQLAETDEDRAEYERWWPID